MICLRLEGNLVCYRWQSCTDKLVYLPFHPSPPLDNIRVMVIVWRLRADIITTALCWIVWHNVHSPQHTYMSSSYRSNRLVLSRCARGSCLELYYCNMVAWFWCDSSLISTTNWFPSVLWHCWFGHPVCKHRPRNDLLCVEWDVKPYTLTHNAHWCEQFLQTNYFRFRLGSVFFVFLLGPIYLS